MHNAERKLGPRCPPKACSTGPSREQSTWHVSADVLEEHTRFVLLRFRASLTLTSVVWLLASVKRAGHTRERRSSFCKPRSKLYREPFLHEQPFLRNCTHLRERRKRWQNKPVSTRFVPIEKDMSTYCHVLYTILCHRSLSCRNQSFGGMLCSPNAYSGLMYVPVPIPLASWHSVLCERPLPTALEHTARLTRLCVGSALDGRSMSASGFMHTALSARSAVSVHERYWRSGHNLQCNLRSQHGIRSTFPRPCRDVVTIQKGACKLQKGLHLS